MKTFRNKYYAFFIALTVLFYSCEVYETTLPKKFNFEHFENFKKNNLKFISVDIEKNKDKNYKTISDPDLIVQNLNQFLAEINQHYNTSITIPDNMLMGIYNNTTTIEVKTFLKNENLLAESEITTYENFVINSKNEGFESAMQKFENDVVNQNLNSEEFISYNNSANTLKIINDQHPSLFEIDNTFSKSSLNPWLCVLSYVLWVLSLIGTLAACLGPQAIFLCIAAGANFIRASYRVIVDCAGYM